VAAAADLVENDTLYGGSIGDMIQPIIPAVLTARRKARPGDFVEGVIEENVRQVVERLKRYLEPVLLEPQRKGANG
tara:strand:- start:293 stop:520 length:228 start_codon:yes stop_codon:yes gene_type:complete